MRNYRRQHSCMNCHHRFEHTDYDYPTIYYCTYKAHERPRCGSVLLNEAFTPDFDITDEMSYEDTEKIMNAASEVGSERMKQWEKWSKDRQVHANGICQHYAIHTNELLSSLNQYQIWLIKYLYHNDFKLLSECLASEYKPLLDRNLVKVDDSANLRLQLPICQELIDFLILDIS